MKENLFGLEALLEDQDLIAMFERVARKNGYTAETVLSTFIKDYIVSGGHPYSVWDGGSVYGVRH